MVRERGGRETNQRRALDALRCDADTHKLVNRTLPGRRFPTFTACGGTQHTVTRRTRRQLCLFFRDTRAANAENWCQMSGSLGGGVKRAGENKERVYE